VDRETDRQITIGLEAVCEDVEDTLFRKIISNKYHVLQPYLTDRADVHNNLRNRNHN